MKKYIILLFLLPVLSVLAQTNKDYLNPSLSIEKKVDLLMKKMSIEEKAAQLCFINVGTSLFDDKGEIDESKVLKAFSNGIGAVTWFQNRMPMEQAIRLDNAMQKIMLEKTRLGIPCIFIGEGLHGFMADGCTSFPQAIALASTWDTTLVEKVFSATGKEMRVRGFHQSLSPVLDLAREPRWGRTEETYSEDPYLTARIGKAAILGLQGHSPLIDGSHVIATLKHFAGHGQGEGGNNTAPVVCDERYFRENHLYPFEIAVKEAGVLSVMPSYNEWSAIPNHSNPWLLNDVLRGEWGFKGHVISDQGGIEDLYRKHFVAKDSAEATKMAIESGIDFEIMDVTSYFKYVANLVHKGVISEATLDNAVRRVLMDKFRLGLFEGPYADLQKAKEVTKCKEHKELALEAAHESIILLKNEKQLLPLDASKLTNLAVIGPNAADLHLGGYTNEPRIGVSVLQGMKDFAGNKFNVLYAEGCKITTTPGSFWDNNNTKVNDEASDKKLIAEAVEVAGKSDVILLVIGENESICREGWSEDHRGDRDDLTLFGRQEELARELVKTGKPVIVLLINGRPIVSDFIMQNVPALLEGWYMGQETGTAVADILFGKVNPSGKLTVTYPKNIGQLPVYYSRKPSRNRSYVNSEMKPAFPFGYGLSYTSFEYGKPVLEKSIIKQGENLKVSVTLKNTGKVAGTEIVQLYLRDKISSVTRPIKELKDFARISLKPGESMEVSFTITPDKLQFYNKEMKRVVEPGEFEVMIGPDSERLEKASFFVQ
ncbi:MAG: glycoside hydrolase family 3 C-terminal domain-containing protein [Bacteroidales bacterium]|nr:glycoside hydrolase family 3 C-terminal domain-containing protein [Bacteroidales bacterium]